ncbi:hypothetical protein C0989_002678 [Termitomyces sp. Mn162]|nr:hypothetical protein C0989_002678 [Termitomyces sp. Mn162]
MSNVLKFLNPAGGLFDQPTAHTLALSACFQANSIPSAFHTWDLLTEPKPYTQRAPQPLPANNDLACNYTLSYIDEPEKLGREPGAPASLLDRPPHFDLCTPCDNAPPNAPMPCKNIPTPLCQLMGPGVPQPPFPNTLPQPLPIPLTNSPATNNNYGPPTPRGLPPPCWALGPSLSNAGQPPGGRPPNSRPPGGWGLAMDNFPPQYPCPKIKTPRTTLAMHWLEKANLTFWNPSQAMTLKDGESS